MMQNTATVIKSAATHKVYIIQKQTKLHYSKLMTKHQKRGRTDSQLSNIGYGDASIFNILHHFEESESNLTNYKNCDNVFFSTQTFCNGRNVDNGASQVAFNLGEFTEADMKEFAKLMELDDDAFFGGAGKSVKGCDVLLDKAQHDVIELLMQDPKFSKTFGGSSVKNIHNNVTVVNKVPAPTKEAASNVSAITSSSTTSSSTTTASPSSTAKTSPASPKNVSVSSSPSQNTKQQQQQQSSKKECFFSSLLHREFSFIGNNHKKGKCTFEIQLFDNDTNILEAAAQEAAAIDEEEAAAAAQQAEQQTYRITLVDVEELPNAHHYRNKWSLIGMPAASCLLIEAIPAVEKVSQQEKDTRFNGSSSPSKKKKPSRSYPSSFNTMKERIKQ